MMIEYRVYWEGVTSGTYMGRDDGYPTKEMTIVEDLSELASWGLRLTKITRVVRVEIARMGDVEPAKWMEAVWAAKWKNDEEGKQREIARLTRELKKLRDG